MKKSDCAVGMWVMARLPGSPIPQTYPAKIRALAQEDVHVDWGGQAQVDHQGRLPSSVGYNDLDAPITMTDVFNGGQTTTVGEQPNVEKAVEEAGLRQEFWAKAFESSRPPEPVPQTGSSEGIRDQAYWPELWRRFQRIVMVKRDLARQLRNTGRPETILTSMTEVLEASMEQDEIRMALLHNQHELTKLKRDVLQFMSDHYDYNPGRFVPPEPPEAVDGTPSSGSR